MSLKMVKQEAQTSLLAHRSSNNIATNSGGQRVLLIPNSQTSLSQSTTKLKFKLNLNGKMCKSVKPKIFPNQANCKSSIQTDLRYNLKSLKQRTSRQQLENCSLTKSKKLTDTQYYQTDKKNKQSELLINSMKQKQKTTVHSNTAAITNLNSNSNNIKDSSTKTNSHRLITSKNSKSKVYANKRVQKLKTSKTQSGNQNHGPDKNHSAGKRSQLLNKNNNISNTNYHSLKRLISSIQFSQNITKFRTIRSFSPEIQLISEQLSHHKTNKKMLRSQQLVLQRMANLLGQYHRIVLKYQKEKQVLIKENRKLKQKLYTTNPDKKQKYKTVADYHP